MASLLSYTKNEGIKQTKLNELMRNNPRDNA